MTVSSTTVKNSYSGNGSTTVFAYTYRIFADSDLQVIIRSAAGTETTKTITTHYTVAGAGDANGGSVTFTVGNVPTATETVVLRREVPQTQAIDYIANDPFPAESHEEGLDRATMNIQQLQEEVDRSIKLSRTNTMTSTEFTVDAADRANKILAFDSTGEISVTQELGTYKGTSPTTTTEAFVVRDIVKGSTPAELNNIYICILASPVGTLLTNTTYWVLIVDAVSAAASEVAAAASAAAAQLSADDAAADLVLTNADVVLTNADVVSTNADVVLTNADAAATAADLVATNQDTIDTAADLVATNQDTIDTAADLVATNQDTIDTAADVVLTNADVLLTNADVVLTHADVVLTNADVVSTGLDKAATNADVLLTAADVISSAASAAAAAASADAFDDVYLGSKASDPTTDNDGDPLAAGMLYYNTTSSIMRIYSGSAWENVAVSTTGLATLTGVETLTNKTLTSPKINEDVVVTSTATELNKLDALSRGSILYGNASAATAILTTGTSGQLLTTDGTDISWGTVSDGTVTTAKLADSSVTTAKLNDGSVSLAKLTATGTQDATTFLRGDNTFQAVSSDYVLLATTDITTSTSSVSFDGYFSATYKNYEILVSNLSNVSDNQYLYARFMRSGSAITTANYRFAMGIANSSGSLSMYTSGTGSTSMALNFVGSNTDGSSAGLRYFLPNPLDTNYHKGITCDGYGTELVGLGAITYRFFSGGQLVDSTSALSGITFFPSSGNISKGNFKLYGIK
jgi:hypothetical protein